MISSLSSMGQLQRKKGVVPSVPSWVAVGIGTGTIATSTNGSAWASVPSNKQGGFSNQEGISIASDNDNRWVAVGYSSVVVTSIDNGNNWSQFLNYPSYSTAIAYGNGKWMVGGIRTNGSTFFATYINGDWLVNTTIINHWTNGIAYGNGKWISVGYGNKLMKYSTDNGSSWTDIQSYGDIITNVTNIGGISSVYGIAYGNGRWVAVGNGSNTNKGIGSSTDGIDWGSSNTMGLTNPRGVAYGKDNNGVGLWVAVGGGVVIITSSTGTSWSNVNSVGGLTSGLTVAYGTDENGVGLWVAAGNDGTLIVTSRNGTDWSPADSFGGLTRVSGIAFNP